jgi:glycine/D-amino acid oxidase-like deaminating enzyme
MSRHVVIIGAGIVGATVAAGLTRDGGVEVTILERGSEHDLRGSTGHAPGYVSLVSESPIMSALAVASATLYEGLESGLDGFDRVGGLELARSDASLANLERRARLAAEAGITGILLDPDEAAAAAPIFVDREHTVGGLLFPADGVARGGVVTETLKAQASRQGARFVYDATVTGIDVRGDRVEAVRSSCGDRFEADDVVIAVGIWGREVAALAGVEVPLAPVAHPYVYGLTRATPSRARLPFVKWREETAYARDHGDRYGIGTHDNDPLALDVGAFDEATQPWPADEFDDPIERALQLLPEEHRFPIDTRLNGLFSMTADNLPLVGPSKDIEGLWIAEALWITHAGGAATALVDMMRGQAPAIDGLEALDPARFAALDAEQLVMRARKKYREIWMPASPSGSAEVRS